MQDQPGLRGKQCSSHLSIFTLIAQCSPWVTDLSQVPSEPVSSVFQLGLMTSISPPRTLQGFSCTLGPQTPSLKDRTATRFSTAPGCSQHCYIIQPIVCKPMKQISVVIDTHSIGSISLENPKILHLVHRACKPHAGKTRKTVMF